MRTLIIALLLALGATMLAGCTRGLEARVAKLEAQNAKLLEKVDALSADIRALAQQLSTPSPIARRPEGHTFGSGAGPFPRRPGGSPAPPEGRPFAPPPKGHRP